MKDRTKEFHQTVTSLLRTFQGGSKKRGSISSSLPLQPTEFTQRALAIQAGIHDLNARINHLTQCNHIMSDYLVTGSRSVMEDITTELAKATLAVKQAISVINKAIEELPNYSKHLYSSQAEHAQAVIKSLQAHYTTSSKLFSHALELLSKREVEQHMRRIALSGPMPDRASSPARPRKVGSPSEYHPLVQGPSGEQNTQSSYASQTLDIESQQEQSGNTLYNQTRHVAIQGIEAAVGDLMAIYQQLAHMVMHQGEMIQRIDQNLDEMQSNVRKGQKQLERFLRNLSSHQWLMIKIFAFIIIFIIIYCLLLR